MPTKTVMATGTTIHMRNTVPGKILAIKNNIKKANELTTFACNQQKCRQTYSVDMP